MGAEETKVCPMCNGYGNVQKDLLLLSKADCEKRIRELLTQELNVAFKDLGVQLCDEAKRGHERMQKILAARAESVRDKTPEKRAAYDALFKAEKDRVDTILGIKDALP